VKRVFVDTGAWFAHLVAEDADHAAAGRLFKQARAERWWLVTTNAVMFETHALLVNRAREGRTLALGFLDDLEAGVCQLERVTRDDEKNATDLLRSHADKGYSFCDALSFVVIERLRVDAAIAFDRHSQQYGRFAVLAT
jgi:predicted nucleic acid-binding protein